MPDIFDSPLIRKTLIPFFKHREQSVFRRARRACKDSIDALPDLGSVCQRTKEILVWMQFLHLLNHINRRRSDANAVYSYNYAELRIYDSVLDSAPRHPLSVGLEITYRKGQMHYLKLKEAAFDTVYSGASCKVVFIHKVLLQSGLFPDGDSKLLECSVRNTGNERPCSDPRYHPSLAEGPMREEEKIYVLRVSVEHIKRLVSGATPIACGPAIQYELDWLAANVEKIPLVLVEEMRGLIKKRIDEWRTDHSDEADAFFCKLNNISLEGNPRMDDAPRLSR